MRGVAQILEDRDVVVLVLGVASEKGHSKLATKKNDDEMSQFQGLPALVEVEADVGRAGEADLLVLVRGRLVRVRRLPRQQQQRRLGTVQSKNNG